MSWPRFLYYLFASHVPSLPKYLLLPEPCMLLWDAVAPNPPPTLHRPIRHVPRNLNRISLFLFHLRDPMGRLRFPNGSKLLVHPLLHLRRLNPIVWKDQIHPLCATCMGHHWRRRTCPLIVQESGVFPSPMEKRPQNHYPDLIDQLSLPFRSRCAGQILQGHLAILQGWPKIYTSRVDQNLRLPRVVWLGRFLPVRIRYLIAQ